MSNSHDTELLNYVYRWLCTKLNSIYEWYMESNDLESKHSLDLPPATHDVCKDLKHVIHLNHVGEVEILRIDIRTPLISLRAKCLYNQNTQESFINMVDFAMNKIQLRSGGFGSKVINTVFDLQRIQLKEEFNANLPTRMAVFKFLSLPFQLKNDFAFRYMIDINDEENNWNLTYKFFKLLVIMNKIQDLNHFIQNFELFSLDAPKIDDMLRRWINAYHRDIYNDNLWMKTRVLDHVGSRACEEFSTLDKNFCTAVIYKNICNQLANDKLCDINIMQILWELFYLERWVGRN